MGYRHFKIAMERRVGSPIHWGDGHPLARLVVLAMRPEAGERRPFSLGPNAFVRQWIAMSGVPPHLVGFHYLVKTPDQRVGDEKLWVEIARTELSTHLCPTAVVCLGRAVADLLSNGSLSNQELRRARIRLESLPKTTLFVTHEPEYVVRAEESGDPVPSVEMRADLQAVADGKDMYFPTLITRP